MEFCETSALNDSNVKLAFSRSAITIMRKINANQVTINKDVRKYFYLGHSRSQGKFDLPGRQVPSPELHRGDDEVRSAATRVEKIFAGVGS
jgi:hypothetical protein